MAWDVSRSSRGLAYRRAGEGPAVVLLHGIPGAGEAWIGVVRALAKRADVIVPDLLGFGASVQPEARGVDGLGPAPQALAVEELLDELGVTGAVVAGHDFGAPVATLLTARRPDVVSSVFLLAGNCFPDTPIPFPLSLAVAPVIGPLARRLLFSAPSLRLMLRQGTGAGTDAPDADIYLGGAAQQAAIATIFAGALTQLAEVYKPVEAALRTLEAPVLVGWGDADPFFSVAQGRRTAEAARGHLRLFEGAGHFLPHERPLEIAGHIETMLADRTV